MNYLKFLLIGILFFTLSCGKFEDGPDISLRTKKARLCREWLPERLIIDGVDISLDSNGIIGEVIFEKTGEYWFVTDSEIKGKWDIDGDQLKLTKNRLGTIEKKQMKVLRLTAKEFWTEEIDSINQIIEWHYFYEKPENLKAPKDSTKNKQDNQVPNNDGGQYY
jgi:hypothetical protein